MRFAETLQESQKVAYLHASGRQITFAETSARTSRPRWTRETENPFVGATQLCRDIF